MSTPDSPITENEMRFHCAAGHAWREVWTMPMDMQAFAARVTAASKCPACGAVVFIGWAGAPPEPEAQQQVLQ